MDDADEWVDGALVWTPAAVARRLRVSPSTLRTWSRRYGISATERTPGGHARYTADDLRRLEAMMRAISSGASPASAAAQAWFEGRTGHGASLVPAGSGSALAPVPAPSGEDAETGATRPGPTADPEVVDPSLDDLA